MKTPASIFAELLEIDPTLAPHKTDIMKAIKTLQSIKPDTQFDAKFAAKLKKEFSSEKHTSEVGFLTRIKHFFSGKMLVGMSILASFCILGGIGWYIHDAFSAPSVVAGNWDFQYKKIPYNVPSIDITVSHDIDPKTVNANSFKISPFVPGRPEVKDGNILSYKLDSKLEIGKRYILELTPDIKTTLGVSLPSSVTFEIEAIGAVKVMRMIPDTETNALGKNPLFIFNVPVIATSSLKKRDALLCPVTFTPALEGECSWTNGSILEYKTKYPLSAATKYDVKIELGSGFLYPMEETFSGSFTTTPLDLITGIHNNRAKFGVPCDSLTDKNCNSWNPSPVPSVTPTPTASMLSQNAAAPGVFMNTYPVSFAPSKGIELVFTAPIDKNILEKYISFVEYSQAESKDVTLGKLNSEKASSLPFTLRSSSKDNVSTTFWLERNGTPLGYEKEYLILIKKWLLAEKSNIPLASSIGLFLKSEPLVRSISLLKNTKNPDSTLRMDDISRYGKIPNQGGALQIEFNEDISLVPGSVRYQVGDRAYTCNLKYDSESVPVVSGSAIFKKQDKKSALLCTFAENLPIGVSGKLIVDQALAKGLSKSLEYPYDTTPKFEIKDFTLFSPTQGCLYATTPIEQTKGIVFQWANTGKIQYVTTYQPYQFPECPKIEGTVTHYADLRLAPNTTYTLAFDGDLRDIYDASLVARSPITGLRTGDVGTQDRFAYTSATKDTQVIPSNVPLIVGLQSVNLSEMYVSVCELDFAEYRRYTTSYWSPNYIPTCLREKTANLPVKNTFWDMSFQKLDVAEFLGEEIQSPFVLVRGSSEQKFNIGNQGYIDSQREFRTLYIRSNLSLALEQGRNSWVILATSYDGQNIPSDLQFEQFNSVESPMKITWNASKKLYLTEGTAPEFLIAKNAKYFGVITRWYDETSNYDHGVVGGVESQETNFIYLSTDRPIYRMGDEVQYKGILRTFSPKGYVLSTAKKVKVRVLSDSGESVSELTLTPDSNSTINGKFILPKEMKTGRYSFEVLTYAQADMKDGGLYAINDANFFVEQYIKPTFKVSVNSGDRVAYLGDKRTATATAEYYFGGKVANAPVRWTLRSQDYYFDPKEYAGYQFTTDSGFFECRYWGICTSRDQFLGEKVDRLDGNGEARFETDLESAVSEWETPKERLVTFEAEVTDPDTGRTVRNTSSNIVHITDGYVGIRTPYYISKTDPIRIEGVNIGVDSSAKWDVRSTVELYRSEWKEVKKQGVDGVFYSETDRVDTLESTETVRSGKDGKWNLDIKPKSGGIYLVRAKYTGKNGKTAIAETTVYVETESYVNWNDGNNSVARLTPETHLLIPGQTALLTLESPVNTGKMLVLIEKDDMIFDSYVRDITSFAEKIEVPIKPEHIPNLYVRVFLIGKNGELPVYKRALASLKVLPDSKKLSVSVTTDKRAYLPGEGLSVSVEVKDANGAPVAGADGSLTVVDQSVLALLGNPVKNPFAFFYDMKRYLGTILYSSLVNLVEKLEIKNINNGEKWWAGEGNKGGDSKKKRGNFKDTAFYRANFTTNAQGKAKIDTGVLPDNLTTWEIESIVSTKTTQIGIGNTQITTQKKVMIQENLPRILRTGDTLSLLPVVFNRTGKESEMEVTLSGSGFSGWSTKKITLKDGESRSLEFEIRANPLASASTLEYATIVFSAKSLTTKEEDTVEKTLPVVRGETWESTATIGSTSNESFDERLLLGDIPKDRAKLSIHYSMSLFGNALDGLEHLMRYPYGCIEQKTSAILPIALTKNLSEALGRPYDIDTPVLDYYDATTYSLKKKSLRNALQEYLVSIMIHERMSGGLGYWSEAEYADFRMTAYVTRQLSDIAAAGVSPDPVFMTRTTSYLKTRFYLGIYENCDPDFLKFNPQYCQITRSDKLQAIRAIVHASKTDIEGYKMWKQIADEWFTTAGFVDVMDIYAGLLQNTQVSDADKATIRSKATDLIKKILTESLVYDSRGAYLSLDAGASRTEYTAKFISVVSRLKLTDILSGEIEGNMMRFLVSMKKSDGSYGSTLETIAVLRAFTDVARAGVSTSDFVVTTSLNGEARPDQTFSKAAYLSGVTQEIDLKSLPDTSTLNIGVKGKGKIYYTLALGYPVPADEAIARDQGIFVEVRPYDLLEYQKIQSEKDIEFEEYINGKKPFDTLRYPKEIREYLTPIESTQVGQLVTYEYRLILSETRDKVAFESYFPSGAEAVNTNLATESGRVKKHTFFEREEYRDDRYFASIERLTPGEYVGTYTVRMTHPGEYLVPPTRAFEFYTPEVFGQTAGWKMKVGK